MLTLDKRQYLNQLISHYDLILQNPKTPLNTYKSFIEEEKYQCMQRLRKIKEADIEGMIMANASSGAFHFIDLAS